MAKLSAKKSSPAKKRISPAFSSLKLSKRIKHPAKLVSVWQLTRRAGVHLWEHKLVFAGITLVYALLNIVLAQGLSGENISELKSQLSQVFTGISGGLAASLIIFTGLLSPSGTNTSEVVSAYRLFFTLLASLAIIWALRQTAAGIKFRIRDAYYRGMYPLVPFILIVLVIGIQLVPLAIGATLYGLVITEGIAVLMIEKVLWALLFALLAMLSLYMIASSIFALYVVTLPDMTPMKALRSARQLVRHRRWTVLRKLLFLPLLLLVIAAVIMLPIILWLTPLSQYVFFVLTMASLVVIHTYIYMLYRDLLNEQS